MEIYQALELMDENGKPTGLYHYTCSNSRGAHPVGHCSPWETCPECKGQSWMRSDFTCEKCGNKGVVRKENPCPGHATSAEAEEHFRQYQLDHARFDGQMRANEQRKCEVCGTWTQGVAIVGDDSHDLCDAHRNREGLDRAMKASPKPVAR
ncbi:MAG TPA: hypothetical protein VGK74_02595 [Symbiobacteriaceae bacterium]